VNLDLPDPQTGTDGRGNPQMTQITRIHKASADGADATDLQRHPQMTQITQIHKTSADDADATDYKDQQMT
jgi:hypothetical protein